MDEVNRINEENKLLTNEEKVNRYNKIYVITCNDNRDGFSFYCKYWDKSKHKPVYVCSSKNFGKCVYIAQQMAKNDTNIPANIAQVKENIDRIRTKTTREIYSESVDKESSVESELNVEESKKRKRNEYSKNITTTSKNSIEKSHSESMDQKNSSEEQLDDKKLQKRKRYESNEFYASEYIIIAETVIISPKYSIRAKVDTQKVPMGTSLHIVRFFTNKIEGVVRGQLHDGRWISIKTLDSDVSCVMEKNLLDNLFQVLFYKKN